MTLNTQARLWIPSFSPVISLPEPTGPCLCIWPSFCSIDPCTLLPSDPHPSAPFNSTFIFRTSNWPSHPGRVSLLPAGMAKASQLGSGVSHHTPWVSLASCTVPSCFWTIPTSIQQCFLGPLASSRSGTETSQLLSLCLQRHSFQNNRICSHCVYFLNSFCSPGLKTAWLSSQRFPWRSWSRLPGTCLAGSWTLS